MSLVKRMKSSQSETFKNGNGDSNTKVTDAVSESDLSGTEKCTTDKTNHFQFHGIRFTPNMLEFIDAFEGKQFMDKITLQNVGRNPVVLRIGEPTSFVFQLKKPSRRPIFLASGASLTRTVTYTYHSDDIVQKSRIPIFINGKQIDYPIVVRKAMPQLEVDPPKIDFGTINLGSEVKTLVLTIYNIGGTRTKYEIDVGKNDLDLVVNPLKGTIKAKHQVKVTVELLGMKEGEFFKEIWIKTNKTPIRVPVLVEVIRPRLLIVYPNGTEELSAIDFPPTFNGTQKAVPIVLKNRGGETALFITVGEVKGEYQFLSEARKNHYIFNFFRLTAEEGRLEPHESRVLTALFRPEITKKTKGWHHLEKLEKKPQKEHVVFFTLNRVHCIERKEIEKACAPFDEESRKSSTSIKVDSESSSLFEPNESTHFDLQDDYNAKDSGFRLCLRGTSVKPEILLQPSKLYFGEINLGQTKQKVLTVTNKSIIRVKFVVFKKMNLRVTPDQLWIGPDKVYELSVKVTPSSAGAFHHCVKIQILGESDVVYPTDEPLKLIAEYTLGVYFTGLNNRKVLVPQIGLGISPIITDEVGMNKELVTFGNADKVPYAAKLLSLNDEFKPSWMQSTEIKDTLMALPNDRSRRFQNWPKDKICRTIFKGLLRYSPPKDTLYTLSSREQIAKNQNNAIWTNYFLMLREIREAYNEESADYKQILTSSRDKLKYLNTEECLKVCPNFVRKTAESDLQNCLVPLSPMYLSYVTVEPKMINFGVVAVKNRMNANLKINNHNVFPIAIKFIPGNSAVTVNEGTVIVHSNSEKTIKVWFELGILGRYYGFLNYVINGSHEFKITISAFVMARTVIVEPKAFIFGSSPVSLAFQPHTLFLTMENRLHAPISYKLQFSPDSPYFSPLEEGVIPPKTRLLSEIVTSLNPRKPLTAELTIMSESNEKELLKISQSYKKLPVRFLNNRVDLKDIPLNLKTKITPIVENECFHDVTFEVIDGSPMPGVTVEPRLGVIKARSFFPLNVQIQIPVVMQISFEIPIIIQTSNKISVKITGNVVMPNIRINPAIINMRKICAQSFDTAMVCIENAGTTPSVIEIDFKACPEYQVLDNKSKFYLNAKQSTSVLLMFEPKDAARFVFYLPIIINNILGPPMMQEMETEKVYFYVGELAKLYEVYGEVRDTEKSGEKIPLAIINCTVACSLITVTPTTVTFHREAFNPKSEKSLEVQNEYATNPYFPSKEVVITNTGTTDVTFCIRNDDLGKSNDSPFDLQPVDPESVEFRLKSTKATLQPGEELTFTATFSPKKPGEYSVQVPVYVRGYNNGVVYCYITLSGQLNHSKLVPEADEIHFYPVPLNVSTEFTFTITAENYPKPTTISCKICELTGKESSGMSTNLTTTWLATPEITGCNNQQKFPIRISFRSLVPAALRCYLVFVDSQNDYCSVLVTAVADNSSVTLHSFLNFFTYRYKIVRQDCSPLTWKADEHPILYYPFEKGHLTKNDKSERKSYDFDIFVGNALFWMMIDKGPVIIVQGALQNFNVGLAIKKVLEDSLTALLPEAQNVSRGTSLALAAKSFHSSKAYLEKIEITYPNYPEQETLYKTHLDRTLQYVERWIYEVVMRCDQYFMIPTSFKIYKKIHAAKSKNRKQKDIIHFLSEIYGEDAIERTVEIKDTDDLNLWVSQLYRFYSMILEFLESQKCFVPHVRTEYLLTYDDYSFYVQNLKNSDTIKPIKEEAHKNSSMKLIHNASQWRQKVNVDDVYTQKTNSVISNKDWFSAKSMLDGFVSSFDPDGLDKEDNTDMGDKSVAEINSKRAEDKEEVKEEYEHTYDILEEADFNQRSTQAWFDIILQIFRQEVLKKLVFKNTIPEVQAKSQTNHVVDLVDKVPVEEVQLSRVSLYGEGKQPMIDNYINNLYNIQERMLLLWLNHHLNVQRKQMWRFINESSIPGDKIINNFQSDLSDSLAFISVTASYCPYVIPDYFRDCFAKPDTPNKIYHNAGRLVQAWRELNIGLTVETMDIVKPNNIFMVMLVAQLYEVLPAMHPRHLICFEAPLSSHQSKRFSVQSSSGKVALQPKLLGEDGKFFKLSHNSMFELKKGKSEEIKITFFGKKIKKIKATLLLSGCGESPYFAKSVAIFLEGQVTDLAEFEKLSFSAPLYKVICTEIPIKSPYSEMTTYEIWYSTVKPVLSETSDLVAHCKPWSKIWYRKVCRRLFLNKNEVSFAPEEKILLLNVTVACFTRKDRFFWLLFRSKTGDFVARIKIKSKPEKGSWRTFGCWYPDKWPSCTCAKTEKEIRTNWADLRSCPLITVIKVPARNVELWNALKTMFLKCVLPQEKTFWAEYFEKDIGLCIVRWLLNPDEEEDVVNEFVPLLQTEMTYKLKVIHPKNVLQIPPQIEIKDVRLATIVNIPVHVAIGGEAQVEVEMVSQNQMEVRRFLVKVESLNLSEKEEDIKDNVILSEACQPCKLTRVESSPCEVKKQPKKFAKLY